MNRQKKVMYENHTCWALRYKDKHFRMDFHFVFQVFGVPQKCQMCAAATLQISKDMFAPYTNQIRTLKLEDLTAAGLEEQAGKPFSHPVVHALHWHLTSVSSKVMGTDESRTKIRLLMWGMCVKKNPPSIWLTLNPADSQDPIVQVLCGEEIDLDKFNVFDQQPSTAAIMADPFVSMQFFHIMVNAILQCLLGVRGYEHNKSIEREPSIFGTVDSYIRTVEAQGQGMLHLHMVLWLQGSVIAFEVKTEHLHMMVWWQGLVTASKMKTLLLGEDFCSHVQKFISANIQVDLLGYTGVDMLSILKQPSVTFSHLANPTFEGYSKRQEQNERSIARTVQVHQCGLACMKVLKGCLCCKF